SPFSNSVRTESATIFSGGALLPSNPFHTTTFEGQRDMYHPAMKSACSSITCTGRSIPRLNCTMCPNSWAIITSGEIGRGGGRASLPNFRTFSHILSSPYISFLKRCMPNRIVPSRRDENELVVIAIAFPDGG